MQFVSKNLGLLLAEELYVDDSGKQRDKRGERGSVVLDAGEEQKRE